MRKLLAKNIMAWHQSFDDNAFADGRVSGLGDLAGLEDGIAGILANMGISVSAKLSRQAMQLLRVGIHMNVKRSISGCSHGMRGRTISVPPQALTDRYT